MSTVVEQVIPAQPPVDLSAQHKESNGIQVTHQNRASDAIGTAGSPTPARAHATLATDVDDASMIVVRSVADALR